MQRPSVDRSGAQSCARLRKRACQTRYSNLSNFPTSRKMGYDSDRDRAIGHLLNKDYETGYSYHSPRRDEHVAIAGRPQ